MKPKNTNAKVQFMVRIAVLAGIMLFMEMTNLGLLKVAVVEIALLIIPVIVGAITMGPAAGAILGGVFGAISFWQCFGKSAFGGALLAINPFYTFLMCVPTRILMGWLCGLIFQILHKRLKTSSFFIASVSGALLNTAFFMTTLLLLFGNSEFILGLQGSMSILAFLVFLVGVNGLVEAVVCSTISAVVSIALHKTIRRS